MRILILILLLVMPAIGFAQAKSEIYRAANGDIVKAHSVVVIAKNVPLKSISVGANVAPEKHAEAMNYLKSDLLGRAIEMAKVMKTGTGKDAKYIGVLQIDVDRISKVTYTEYYIDLRAAIKNHEITIVKK